MIFFKALNFLKRKLKHSKNREISKDIVTTALFAEKAKTFMVELDKCSDFSEMRTLWQKTNIKYSLANRQDPFSKEYLSEIYDLYKLLSGLNYAVDNEHTSNKFNAEGFELGFPYLTKDAEMVAINFLKVSQAIQTIVKYQGANLSKQRIIEFGSGWGNLAIPLLKSQADVTIIDIDQGFIDRLERICTKENLHIHTINSDFIDIFSKTNERFDTVIFQSSFHHCIEFDLLLKKINQKLLTNDGKVFFFDEPVFDNYFVDWGLRGDGESLWAIIKNKWMELGFDLDFFIRLNLKNGFFLTVYDKYYPLLGHAYVASQCHNYIAFADVLLPSFYSKTWHAHIQGDPMKFSKGESFFPLSFFEDGSVCEFEIANYLPVEMSVTIVNDTSTALTLKANETQLISFKSCGFDLQFIAKTFVPNNLIHNGDTRKLSFAINKMRIHNL